MDAVRNVGVIGAICALVTGITLLMPSVAASHILDLIAR